MAQPPAPRGLLKTPPRPVHTTGWAPSVLVLVGLISLVVGQRIATAETLELVATWLGGGLVVLGAGLRVRGFVTAGDGARQVEGMLLAATVGVLVALGLYGFAQASAGTASGSELVDNGLWVVLTVGWLTTLTCSVASLAFMELTYQQMPLAAGVEPRRVRGAAQTGLTLALAVIFLGSLGYVFTVRDIKRDLSYLRTAAPSAATLAMVERLDEPVEVVLLYPELNEVYDRVTDYFEALERASAQIKLRRVDHALVPSLARAHKVRGNGFAVLIRGAPEDAKAEADKAAEDKATEEKAAEDKATEDKAAEAEDNDDDDDARPAPDNRPSEKVEIGTDLSRARARLRNLDERFQKAFSKLTRAPRVLHVTVGHGERSRNGSPAEQPGDRLKTLHTLLERFNIKSERLGLAQGLGSEVPTDTRAVAIVGPQQRFLPEEVDALGRYVESGGRLLITLDPDVDHGLQPLLHRFGVALEPGVASTDRDFLPRTRSAVDHAIALANTYSSHPTVTTAARQAREYVSVFFRAGGLRLATDAEASAARGGEAWQPGRKPRVMFPIRTGATFWRDLDGDYMFDKGAETRGQLNVMAAATVRAPVRRDADGKPIAAARPGANEGRIAIIADGDFATDKLMKSAGNVAVVVDALRWMLGADDVQGSLTSEEDVPIEHGKDEDRLWFYATTFALPLPLFGIGLWVAARRRRREARR
jgi:hypothetical protein